MAEQSQKKVLLKIPFINNEQALLVSEVLSVDKEFKGSGVKREISVEEDYLVVNFEGVDYKKLRVIINGFLKNVHLIVKTFSIFGSL